MDFHCHSRSLVSLARLLAVAEIAHEMLRPVEYEPGGEAMKQRHAMVPPDLARAVCGTA